MRGRDVPRKGGWDCHGLPVELEVEKELGLHNKHEIEAYGIEAFNARCRASVLRYVEDWSSLTSRSGVWIDTADAYWTMDNDYVESVWWLGRQLWDEGLLYEGHRVTPYCGRCGTALSSHEVAQGYQDVVDPSIYVRFPLVGDGAPDADLLVWTTTPWTLISNAAAAVGPTFAYVRVPSPDGGRDLILGERAAGRLYPEAPVLDRWTGADMAAAGWRYQRPFEFLEPIVGKDGWRVVAADYVTDDDGSGIVHIAPAFGEDDSQVGRRGTGGSSRTPTPRSSPTSGVVACSWPSRPTSTATPTAGGVARRSSTGPRRRGSSAPRSGGVTSSPRTRRSAGTPSTSSTAG